MACKYIFYACAMLVISNCAVKEERKYIPANLREAPLQTFVTSSAKHFDKKSKIRNSVLAERYLRKRFQFIPNSRINEIVKIKNNILKSIGYEDSSISVRVVKTPDFMASNPGDRVIFLSLGVIDKLKNSSQLAFILSHEISHIVNSDLQNKNKFISSDSQKSVFSVIGADLSLGAAELFYLDGEIEVFCKKINVNDRRDMTSCSKSSYYTLFQDEWNLSPKSRVGVHAGYGVSVDKLYEGSSKSAISRDDQSATKIAVGSSVLGYAIDKIKRKVFSSAEKNYIDHEVSADIDALAIMHSAGYSPVFALDVFSLIGERECEVLESFRYENCFPKGLYKYWILRKENLKNELKKYPTVKRKDNESFAFYN